LFIVIAGIGAGETCSGARTPSCLARRPVESERGDVDVDNVIVNQPWADDLPVHVHCGV
jgi:hypothetical protein